MLAALPSRRIASSSSVTVLWPSEAEVSIPAGTYAFSSSSFDAEGEPTSYSAYSPTQTVQNTFNVRGELTQFLQQIGPQVTSLDFDGLLLPQTNVVGQQTIDPVSAVQLGATTTATSTPPPAPVPYCPMTTQATATWAFDTTGRESSAKLSSLSQNANSKIPCPETIVSRSEYEFLSFDVASRETQLSGQGSTTTNGQTVQDIPVSISYGYDGTDHVRLISGDATRASTSGYSPTSAESVYWNGDNVLFTTDKNGKLDDLKIGEIADITTAGFGAGLTVWDRELDGEQVSYHNATGVGPWVAPSNWTTIGYGLTSPDQFGILFTAEPRTDAVTDLHTMFVGGRTLDGASLNFTSRDASPGSLTDPLSLKPYVYGSDDPLLFNDPSGNDGSCGDPVCLSAPPTGGGGGNPFAAIIGAIGALGGFFHDLFGGGHKSHATPPRPITATVYYGEWDEEGIRSMVALGFTADAMEGTLQVADAAAASIVLVAGAPEAGAIAVGLTVDGEIAGAGAGAAAAEAAAAEEGAEIGAASYEEQEAAALERYPHGDDYHYHHITPKYMGGAANGPVTRIRAAYHWVIHNEIKKYVANRLEASELSDEELRQILRDVYEKFPLPPDAPLP